mgnify:FL=1|nr:proximal tail sheath stabilization [uncultured Mediterranean phage uvMED]|tara:strand:+ start:64290 stop:65294 length:1005 start_codon:yes stop_codon:yes gene_type:complete
MLGAYTYNKIIRKCVIGFGTLFNNIECRKEKTDGTIYSRLKVPLAYGPRQKFLARLEQQADLNQKVAITVPRLSFEMTGISYDSARKLAPITMNLQTGDKDTVRRQYTPVPYNIDFELNVISKTNDESLEILEQIVPIFQPSYQMTIKLVDEMKDYRDIPIILNSINYSDDYEGSFDDRKITLVTMSFTCKTYIFGPVGTQGPIKKAKADIYTTMPSATATRQVEYQVTPKALTDKNKDGTTELAGAITARNLSVEVVDYSDIPTQSYIEIGNEVMYVKSKTSPNKLSVRRAQNGTTAAAAVSGTPVDLIDATDDALLTSGDDFGFSESTSYYE